MSKLKTGRPTKKGKIASAQKMQEDTIRMNVNIPKSFYKQIKQKALDEDTNVTEVVKKALDEYMSK